MPKPGPLDCVRDASIVVSVIGFAAQWFPHNVVQLTSTFVMGGALVFAVVIILFRHGVAPLAGRYLDNAERKAMQHLRDANSENSGVVFERKRGFWMTSLARVAGTSYEDFGFMVFMQCPERLWGHGGIGQSLASEALHGEDFDLMVFGGGPIGKLEAIGRVREFVLAHDRRVVLSARRLPELRKWIRGFHDEAQKLLLPDARATAQSVVETEEAGSAKERVEALTYQLTSMIMAADFIETLYYRLTKTDIRHMNPNEVIAQPGYHPPPIEYSSLPLMFTDDTQISVDHDGLIDLMTSWAHKSLVLGWVLGHRGDIDDGDIGTKANIALDNVMASEAGQQASSLQEIADLTLKRFDEIRSTNGE